MGVDILLIQRDALASSLLGNLTFAVTARKEGANVAVLFTQEALAALCGGVFLWPKGLMGQDLRLQIADNSAFADVGLLGRREGRQINALESITKARELGVAMYACPVWTGLLGLAGKLPEGVAKLDTQSSVKMVREAGSIVGSF